MKDYDSATYPVTGTGFCLLAEGDTYYLNNQSDVLNGWWDDDAGSTCRAFLSIESAWTQELATAAANYTADDGWMNAVGFKDATAHTDLENAYLNLKNVESTKCTYAQLCALKAANDNYANAGTIGIEDGKTYMIVSAYTSFKKNPTITRAMAASATDGYYGGTVNPGWEDKDDTDMEQYWYFVSTSTDNTYYVKNLSTSTYITTKTSMSSTETAITLASLENNGSGKGQYTLTISGSEKPLHCNYSEENVENGPLTEWNAYIGNASAWYIVPQDCSYTLTIGSTGYATLCLPFDAAIPSGATVYKGSYNKTGSYVTLIEYGNGSVLEAGDGVIVTGTAGTYTFTRKTSSSAQVGTDNDLVGTSINQYLTTLSGGTAYILAKKNGVIGFYKWAAGTTDASKYIAAHKAYLWVADANNDEAREFIPIGEEDLTKIADVKETPSIEQDGIYTLNGQRVSRTQPGNLYIINGRKVLVR